MTKIYVKIRYTVTSALILINALVSFANASPTVDTDSYIVITHKNTTDKNISIGKLQGIFGLKIKHWDNATPIKVYATNPLGNEHHKFCKLILGVFSHQLQRSWDRLTYSGRAPSPTIVASFEEMIEAVSNTPGAIGYIPRDALNEKTYKLELKIGNNNEG